MLTIMFAAAGAPELSARLSPEEMGRGILVANRNARRLLGDAISLFAHRRYPSATALAVLALEESVKWWTLVQTVVLTDELKIKAVWQESRLHRVKLDKVLKLLAGALAASGGVTPTVSTEALGDAVQLLKLRCMYTAFVVGRRWSEPPQVCAAAECRNVLSVALLATTGHLRITGQRLGSLLKQVPGLLPDLREEELKQALISWSEGQQAGILASEDDAESEAFRVGAQRELASVP